MNLAKVRNEICRASGVIGTLYAICRDYIYSQDNNTVTKLDDIVSDTINGLMGAISEIEGEEKDDA